MLPSNLKEPKKLASIKKEMEAERKLALMTEKATKEEEAKACASEEA